MSRLPELGPRGVGWVAIQIVLFWVVVAVGVARPGDWTGAAAALTAGVGSALAVAGLALAFAAGRALAGGDALTALPQPRAEAQLVDDGPYRIVRHPIYGGVILCAAGWALIRASLPALAATALVLAFLDLKRRREEAWLVEHFAEYDAYRTRTRRMIPWIW